MKLKEVTKEEAIELASAGLHCFWIEDEANSWYATPDRAPRDNAEELAADWRTAENGYEFYVVLPGDDDDE